MRIGWFIGLLPLGAIRPLERAACAITHAECAGVSGPGYYATGLVEDVLGRLPQVESSLCILRVTFRMSGQRQGRPTCPSGTYIPRRMVCLSYPTGGARPRTYM